ncbi:uncharacterized protein LOC111041205 [Myzus persicae]|uniref:uncharacterized protein LOC111041205 n=1 Tax=Myzus persicae TaxID=13164 RepID=UPI000B938A62|nr:uncharacterized protein LOC111041205 [Myzus persicae]
MKPNTLLSHKKTPTQLLSTFEVQTLDHCEFTKVDDPAIVHHSVTKQQKLILHSPISDVSRKRIMIKSSLQNQQQQTPSTSMSEQNMSNNIKKVLFPLQNSDGSKGSATMSRIGTNKKYDFGMTDSGKHIVMRLI